MKTWKHFTFAAVLAILGIAFTACDNGNGNNDNPPEEIRREFTITGFAKDIKVIDTRAGSNDTDLETLGVISKLDTLLKAQTTTRLGDIVNRNLEISVEETTVYDNFKAYSGNRFGVNIGYILSDDEWFSFWLETIIHDVYDLP